MKNLFLLLLLVPIITFSQNDNHIEDAVIMLIEYQEAPIPKLKNAIAYKGLVAPVLEGSTLIVYTSNGNYELSRCTINSNSEVKCSGKNFFVVQDKTTRFAIIYNHLCKEIGRVKLEAGENVAIMLWDGSDYYGAPYDFKIISRKINKTKYFSRYGKLLYKKAIDEDSDFDY